MSDHSLDAALPPDDGALPLHQPDPHDADVATDPTTDAPDVPWWQRTARRVVRRPTEWFRRPWPAERVVQYFTALVILLGCTVVLTKVIHLDLVFTDTTPTGGDMGAHVMAPAYLRDHLLPHFQLTGWSNYWYSGFPLYVFYMLPPALLIVLFNVVLPYGVAFKLVTVLGILSLPWCCWAFGRLARFRYPTPELMALAAMAFLFDESFSIYGGNVKSTMAGEFSFSIALSLAIIGLGVLARGLETGKYRSLAAVLLALAMLTHGLVLLFVALAAVLLWLVWMDRTRFVYGLTVGITMLLLVAFWIIPFVANKNYMTDMKYHGKPDGGGESFWDMFFPWPTFWDFVVSGFALVGFISSIVRRHLNGAWLGILVVSLMAATYLGKDSIPGFGMLWNPRVLPFLYLMRLLLMMVGVVDVVYFLVRALKFRELHGREIWVTGLATAVVVTLVVVVSELFVFREVPGARMVTKDGKSVYAWGFDGWDPITLTPKSTDALSDAWPRYNYLGYEERPYYGEYKALIDTMAGLGKSDGCGRALWEINSDNGYYGTTMALMLLPHWTNGCIQSDEGLFFEASGTTPYHFLTAAAMSKSASNPVRELRYTDNNAAVGAPMMQKLGIKYLMVWTDAARAEADKRPELTALAESGPWKIYGVADSDVVVPLTVQPVVVNTRSGDQRERYLEVGTSWFQNPDEWAALPATDGPSDWQHIDVAVDLSRRQGSAEGAPGRRVDIVTPVEPIVPKALPAITVSNYTMGNETISFDVSQPGVPVLVKVSYFPNWTVEGAKGPYRVAPNYMVVVPTSTHVRLSYESTWTDRFAYLLTFAGIVLLFVWRRRGDVVPRSSHPFDPRPTDDDADTTTETSRDDAEFGQLDDLDDSDDFDDLLEPDDADPPAEPVRHAAGVSGGGDDPPADSL